MKKTIYSILAVAAGVILSSGCSKDNQSVEKNVSGKVTFSAIIPCEFTKTAIDGTDNTKVNWVEDDSLNVWDEYNDHYEYELISGAGTTSGTFDGEVSGTAQYAMYPCFQSKATIDAGVITTNVKSIQTVPAGSFDPKAAIMVGTISGTVITFHHAVAYLKITAPSNVSNLAEITIESNGGVQLTGDAKFAAADGSFTATGTAKNYVTVKPVGASFTAGAIYYAAVIPGTYTGGLTVRYLYKDNTAHTLTEKTKSNTTSLTLAAGHTKVLGAATEFDHTYKAQQLWAGGPYWAETNIGAENKTDYGQYFAWGYTTGYSWNGSAWNPSISFDGTGFPDYAAHTYSDMAAANWGTGWNVPTNTDFSNLISSTKTSIENVTDGTKGIKVKGKSDYAANYIFLPYAGCGDGSSLYNTESYGYYWSSVQDDAESAYDLNIGPNNVISSSKRFGCSVRPVHY